MSAAFSRSTGRSTARALLLVTSPIALLSCSAAAQEAKPAEVLPEITVQQEAAKPTKKKSATAKKKTGPSAATAQPAAAKQPTTGTSLGDFARANPATTFSGEALAVDGYMASNAATFKSNAPLLETPAGISVVTSKTLEDQKAFSVQDAVRSVAGVQPVPSLNGFFGFNVRGFKTFDTYRNGMRADYSNFDFANVERIEVLKGPAGMLYGRMDPGGLINIVTKKPLETSHTEITQDFGSFDFKKTTVDSTGPVTSDKSLLYRFVGSYTDADSFRDFMETDRYQINPSVLWKPTDGTEIFFDFEVYNDKYRNDYGIPAVGNRPAAVPLSRSFIDPNDPLDHTRNKYTTLGISQRLTDDWTLKSQFMYRDVHLDGLDIIPAPAFDAAALHADGTLDRNLFYQNVDQEDWTFNLELYGKFYTGAVKHELLTGYERYKWDWRYDTRGDYINGDPALAINIYNPVYGLVPAGISPGDLVFNGASHGTQEWHAGYVSDHMKLDRFHLIAGVRYDDITAGRGFSDVPTDTASIPVPTHQQAGWSPRAGVLYEVSHQVSVYANWAKGFAGGASTPYGSLPPEESRLYEAGLKFETPDKAFAASLAVYQLTKFNIPTADPADPLNNTLSIGEARSEGVEVDFSGQITRQISVLGSYAYTDTVVVVDYYGLQGNQLDNVPRHAGSLWLNYDFDGVKNSGWTTGGGITALSDRFGDAENTFVLPGYARVDVMAAYEWDVAKTHMAFQLNVKNIFDTEYYESTEPFYNAHPRLGIYPGAPREFIGTVKASF